MIIRINNYSRYRKIRVNGRLVSKRKMTEEDKEVMKLHMEKPRNKFAREEYKPIGV